MAKGRMDEPGSLAAERAHLEAAGKNWKARHVADLADLSELSVKRLARAGKLPSVRVGGGWEFPPKQIRAWYVGEPWTSRPGPSAPRRPDKVKDRLDEPGVLAMERARLEVAGKNWKARHVADLVDLSELSVKRLARAGKLPSVRVGGGWEFPPKKIRAWYVGEPWTPRPGPPAPPKPDKN